MDEERLCQVEHRIPKVTLLVVFRMRCGTLNSNQSKDSCEWVMEFPFIHFNVLQ